MATGRNSVLTGLVWGSVGAIGVPVIVRTTTWSLDQATAALVVYMSAATVLLQLVAYYLAKKASKAPKHQEVEISGRVKFLATIAVVGSLAFYLASVAAVASAIFASLGMDWALVGARRFAMLSIGVAVASTVTVVSITFVFVLSRELGGIVRTAELKLAQVCLVALAVVVVLSNIMASVGPQFSSRHVSMSRHAA